MNVQFILLWAISLVFVSNVSAQDVLIQPLKNSDPFDVSAVSAECDIALDGQQMTCHFVQVRVDLVKKPDEAAAELEKMLQEMQKESPQKIAESCKDGRKQMADLTAKVMAQEREPRLKTFWTGLVARYDSMCNEPTPKNIRDYIWYSLEKDTKTCRIGTKTWKETFTKQLRGKWVSNRGPSGLCGAVLVSSLESKPFSSDPQDLEDLHLFNWTYESQRIVTNKDRPLCYLGDSKSRFSWDAKDFDRSCEFIEFRMF